MRSGEPKSSLLPDFLAWSLSGSISPTRPTGQQQTGISSMRLMLSYFGTVAPEERRLVVPQIADKARAVVVAAGGRGPVRVFAPLGVGHHVDHQLTFWAARRLGPRFGTLFYEDYPYAGRHGALKSRLAEIGLPAQPLVTPVS